MAQQTTVTEDAKLARYTRIAELHGEGHSLTEIAKLTGERYSTVEAATLAMRPDVLAARAAAQQRAQAKLEAAAEQAASSLVDLATGAEDENVRRQAAESVLDRIGVTAESKEAKRSTDAPGIALTLNLINERLHASVTPRIVADTELEESDPPAPRRDPVR